MTITVGTFVREIIWEGRLLSSLVVNSIETTLSAPLWPTKYHAAQGLSTKCFCGKHVSLL